MNTIELQSKSVKELRKLAESAGLQPAKNAHKGALLMMLAALPDESTESAESAESETNQALAESIVQAESTLRDGIASKARIALVRDESKRHTLYMGSTANKDTDVFASFRLMSVEESFAVLDTDASRFVRLADVRLETHALYVQISLTGYSRVENTLRGNRESVTRINGASFLIPVKLAYQPESDKFSIESVLPVIMSYSKTKGFNRLDDSAINKRLPGMVADTLRLAIIRKLNAFISNSAESVNDLQLERNGKPTLYGQWKAAETARKARK